MQVTKWNSHRKVNVKIGEYYIDWAKAPSKGQQAFQDFIFPYWKNDLVLAEMRIPGSLKRCDIVNVTKKVVVEYSPDSHHFEFNKFFHGTRANFLKTIKSDIQKKEWIEQNGFLFVELIEEDIKKLSIEYLTERFSLPIW